MEIDGGCHCGELTYKADIELDRISICHCLDCQILSGTAFRTAVSVEKSNFSLLSGTPKTYTKLSDSGNPRTMAFCENCGTQLYGTGIDENTKFLSLRIGTSNQRRDLKPTRELWRRSAVSWIKNLGIKNSFDRGAE